MKNTIIRLLAPVGLALLLVATGCELSPTEADEADDITALQSLIAEEADFFIAELFSAQGAEDPSTPAKVLADIDPKRFGRHILTVDKDISITVDNTTEPATAEVTWNATRTGEFILWESAQQQYTKDFVDNMIRFATFERRGNTSTKHRGWRMTSISGTEIVSEGATAKIDSISLTSLAGIDTTFDNVSTLVERDYLPVLAPGDTVTITVFTPNTDDVVLLHHPAWATGHNNRNYVRRELTNNGDGTYTGTWVTRGMVWRNGQMRNPARHITIDVLTNGTVYTDDQPYDSVAWGFVYRVDSQ